MISPLAFFIYVPQIEHKNIVDLCVCVRNKMLRNEYDLWRFKFCSLDFRSFLREIKHKVTRNFCLYI